MQGLVSYNGDRLARGDMHPSADRIIFFEDFLGSLENRKIDTGATDTAIVQYPGVMVSTAGTDATLVPVASVTDTAGGAISFTAGDGAPEGLSIPNLLIDVDAGEWYVETRVKVTTVGTTTDFHFGLSEDVSPIDFVSQDDGAANEDGISMFCNTGSTTDGLLEFKVTKNTAETISGAGGMAGAQLVADTFHKLAIHRRREAGGFEIDFIFDGTVVGTAADTNVSDTLMQPMIVSGDDGSGAVEVDYIYVNATRA